MDRVRAKFRVHSVTQHDGGGVSMKAYPVYGGSPEDNSYAEATPSGQLELTISNKLAQPFFQPGEVFYATFEKAPQA